MAEQDFGLRQLGFKVGDIVDFPSGRGAIKGVMQIGAGLHAVVAQVGGAECMVPLEKLRKAHDDAKFEAGMSAEQKQKFERADEKNDKKLAAKVKEHDEVSPEERKAARQRLGKGSDMKKDENSIIANNAGN